jgi:hypothetical protein
MGLLGQDGRRIAVAVRHAGRSVLVGIDESEPAINGVRWAAREAARRDVLLRPAGVSLAAEGRDRIAAVGAGTPDLDDALVLARLDRAAGVAKSLVPGLAVEQAVARKGQAGVVVSGGHQLDNERVA